ncbi:hypothetical protein BO71DRAFT_432500 [Aspergillus ellipticus CBS 707.79]|uniref:Uncharacterized protein n=1 Tax=Aspergillus ellipticus CBS 707.79 TaxID=1448320 RepID=A0A319D3F9_9EURO|nr:hypothetical protein BO71DRAFT_432500 [Aspergillus ellipticus CBS 707.79]
MACTSCGESINQWAPRRAWIWDGMPVGRTKKEQHSTVATRVSDRQLRSPAFPHFFGRANFGSPPVSPLLVPLIPLISPIPPIPPTASNSRSATPGFPLSRQANGRRPCTTPPAGWASGRVGSANNRATNRVTVRVT